jgi:serine protease AprX
MTMTRKTTHFLALVLLLWVAIPSYARQARRGWTKVQLTHADGSSGPFPPALLAGAGGELLVTYDSQAIGHVPAGAVAALKAEARKFGVAVSQRDDFDVMQLPSSARVDARHGIREDVPQEGHIRQYPANKPGLFLIQFVAPARSEWVAELVSMGWTLARYIPANAYVVAGRPELAGRTRQLDYIQFVDFFHPYQKAKQLVRDDVSRDLVFELSASADSSDAIEAISAVAENGVEVYRGNSDTLVFARLASGKAEPLLRHPLVISVSPRPIGGISDERQVMSLTSNLNSNGSAPTTPTGYTSWITERCPACATMSPSTWRVGLADTGLDNGTTANGHLDLAGRKFYGARFYTGNNDPCTVSLDCDRTYHGTVVAGIMVGNASNNIVDAGGGFYWGMGVAPWAGVFSTKIATFVNSSQVDFTRIFEITRDAALNDVTIQNHSLNEYRTRPDPSGQYSSIARQYDIAVRDADDALSSTRTPIFIAVSAGNNIQGDLQSVNRFRVLGPGTAKNVLTMGGTENHRPGILGCEVPGGDDFRNIMQSSRTGTLLPGYIKPDLVAPAGPVGSMNSTEITNPQGCIVDLPEFDPLGSQGPRSEHYDGDSGTSFAAPVGAASALIVKRYLGATPDATSPALAKAMLIAGAKSIRGGIDRAADPDITVGPFPNGQQGFGRISLDDIITGSTPPIWYDQSPARTFTSGMGPFRTRLRVRDASKPVKVALVWTDAPGTPFVGNPLVNDLDLSVYPSGSEGVRYNGNYLHVVNGTRGEESIPVDLFLDEGRDGTNNVEVVRAFLSTNEELDVQVSGLSIWGDTDGVPATFEQDFALVVTNADAVNGGAPIAPVVTANRSVPHTAVAVAWTPAVNVMNVQYEVWRGTSLANMQKIVTLPDTGWLDTSLPANTAYVYRIVAVANGGVSVPSNNTVATTIAWTDSTICCDAPIKSAHWSELRNGIDFIRTAANLSTGAWASPISSGAHIAAAQVAEMRTRLAEAFATLGVPAATFTTPLPTSGVTFIIPAHVLDLRSAIE